MLYTRVLAEGPGASETKDTSSTVMDGGVPHRDSTDAGVPLGVSAGSGGTGGTSVPRDESDCGDGSGGPILRAQSRGSLVASPAVANVRPGATFVGKPQAYEVIHAKGQSTVPYNLRPRSGLSAAAAAKP